MNELIDLDASASICREMVMDMWNVDCTPSRRGIPTVRVCSSLMREGIFDP